MNKSRAALKKYVLIFLLHTFVRGAHVFKSDALCVRARVCVHSCIVPVPWISVH